MTPALARHATHTAIAAVAIDWTYTAIWWLALGRPHPAWRYFLIVGQLSVETALILHLWSTLKRAEDQQAQPGELRAVA